MGQGSESKIALPAIVDLDVLDTMRDRLADAIEVGPVVVSGAAVERVSTNALLLLVSAAESARRNSFSFAIADASEPMRQAIARLGFEPTFAGMMKG